MLYPRIPGKVALHAVSENRTSAHGILLALLFSLTVVVACLISPKLGGARTVATWNERRFRALPDLLPPVVIFLAVVASIYAGWATATEAAALGVIAALALAALRRVLTLKVLRDTFEGTVRTTAMNMAIILAAYFLNFVMTGIGLTRQVNSLITSLGLSPYELLAVVVIFYLILGMFMETLSMMVATVPIVTPVVVAAGFDPVWFGIVVMLLMELAMIRPPVGINFFVAQGLRKRGRIDDVIVGALPFVVAIGVMVLLLVIWPQIAYGCPAPCAEPL